MTEEELNELGLTPEIRNIVLKIKGDPWKNALLQEFIHKFLQPGGIYYNVNRNTLEFNSSNLKYTDIVYICQMIFKTTSVEIPTYGTQYILHIFNL
jgi:hypothetical protein